MNRTVAWIPLAWLWAAGILYADPLPAATGRVQIIFGKHEFDAEPAPIEAAFLVAYHQKLMDNPDKELILDHPYLSLFHTADCDGEPVKAAEIAYDHRDGRFRAEAVFILEKDGPKLMRIGDAVGSAADAVANPFISCGED